MLDRFRGIWNSNQTIDTKRIKEDSLKSLKEQYDAKIQAKVLGDEEIKEFTELIQEKEQSILELLNALDMLYTAKNTLTEEKEKTFIEEEPFEHAKEYDEIFNAKSNYFGFTGPQGYVSGPLSGSYNTGNLFVGNSNLNSQFNNPLTGKQKK